MARPRIIEDEELIESLRQSFLELGAGATTQELAARAGVSEGTLFKRFGSKQRMFGMAMRLPPLEGAWFNSMLEPDTTPLRVRLTAVAIGICAFLQQLIPRLSCTFGRSLRPEDLRLVFGEQDAPSLVLLRRLTRMFELEMARGRVRPVPARHLAEMFLGAIQHHMHMTHFVGSSWDVEPDSMTFARGLAASVDALVSIQGPKDE